MSNEESAAFEEQRIVRRRHFTPEQKRALLDEAARPGKSMSIVARQYGVAMPQN